MNSVGDLQLFLFVVVKRVLVIGFPLFLLLTAIRWYRAGAQAGAKSPRADAGSSERVPGLDALRGVAILMVFVYHGLHATFGFDQLKWSGWFPDFHVAKSFLVLFPATFGSGGVAVFFVISGFCIHLVWHRSSTKSWKEFFMRRAYRIVPPYLVALIFFAFFYPLTRMVFFEFSNWVQFFSHLALVHNLINASTFFGINPAFWSIGVEAQLYLIYPLLMVAVFRYGWRGALWLAVLCEVGIRLIGSLGFFGVTVSLPYVFSEGPFAYWFSWAIGAHLAEGFISGRQTGWARWPLWFWPVLALISKFIHPLSSFLFIFVALSSAVLIAHMLQGPERFRWIPRVLTRHLGALGVVSYSFYLLHQPFVLTAPLLLSRAFPGQFIHPLIKYGCCLCTYPLIFVLSRLSYRWVEMPAIAAGKRAIRSLRGKK
jgi:peptidoglycan/LPS O-acetylase OafA/YrhL